MKKFLGKEEAAAGHRAVAGKKKRTRRYRDEEKGK